MKVAVLGLGAMGTALAGRAVDRGHEVVGWNRTPRSFDVPTAPTAVEAVSGADIVLVVVADGSAVDALCSEQLLGSLAPQAVLAIVSTVAPETVQGIAYARVVDAPVVGAPQAVASGTARFLVGGSDGDVATLAPLLADLGAGHVHCGPLGAGAVMKIGSNLQLVAGVAALAEAVATARGHGISDDVIRETYADSPLVSPASRLRLGAVLDPAHPGWFGPALASKDLGLAADLAAAADLRPAIGPAAQELLGRLGDWPDFAAVIEALHQP
jgi:3-hydroxyisobutyrate dehydrogenase